MNCRLIFLLSILGCAALESQEIADRQHVYRFSVLKAGNRNRPMVFDFVKSNEVWKGNIRYPAGGLMMNESVFPPILAAMKETLRAKDASRIEISITLRGTPRLDSRLKKFLVGHLGDDALIRGPDAARQTLNAYLQKEKEFIDFAGSLKKLGVGVEINPHEIAFAKIDDRTVKVYRPRFSFLFRKETTELEDINSR